MYNRRGSEFKATVEKDLASRASGGRRRGSRASVVVGNLAFCGPIERLPQGFAMPGAGLEPARPRGGHLILSRPIWSRPISADLDFPCLSDLFVLLVGAGLSAGLGGSGCHSCCHHGNRCVYLRPSTRFNLLPRASLLPGLGLWGITRPTRLQRSTPCLEGNRGPDLRARATALTRCQLVVVCVGEDVRLADAGLAPGIVAAVRPHRIHLLVARGERVVVTDERAAREEPIVRIPVLRADLRA